MCWATPLVTVDGADPQLFRGGLFFAGLAMLVLIAAVSHRGAFAGRLLGTPILVWIGLRSYGLYLFHWPIFMIIRGVAGNPLSVREFAIAMAATVCITELSFRYFEMPIRTGGLSAGWLRFRRGMTTIPRPALVGGAVALLALSVFAVATLATAPLRQNEIAEALDENEQFTTDLLDVQPAPDTTRPPRVASTVVVESVPDDTVPRTTIDPTAVPAGEPVDTVATDPSASTIAPSSAAAAAPTVTETTVEPPIAAAVAVPVQAGVVNDMSTMTPLTVPEPVNGGYKLVALGDSVMLGAAEELGALGFLVDAVVSRQMKNYLPDMQAIRDMGVFGSAVVVHLGTNGPFSQETLDQTMAVLADVPVVLMITSKAEREWVAGNNEQRQSAAGQPPERHGARLGGAGGGVQGRLLLRRRHPPHTAGQTYYTSLVSRVLGLA